MKQSVAGFALLEVIISIVILAAVLAGAIGLVWSAANAVERNQDRLTAIYLAQECIEEARNVRDSAWRQHLPWDCAFAAPPSCVDLAQPIVHLKNGEHLIPLFGEASKFSRIMTTEQTGETLSITCDVSWPRRSGTEHVFLDTILTNWRKI